MFITWFDTKINIILKSIFVFLLCITNVIIITNDLRRGFFWAWLFVRYFPWCALMRFIIVANHFFSTKWSTIIIDYSNNIIMYSINILYSQIKIRAGHRKMYSAQQVVLCWSKNLRNLRYFHILSSIWHQTPVYNIWYELFWLLYNTNLRSKGPHSSEVWGLLSMKCSCKTLQNVLYFM